MDEELGRFSELSKGLIPVFDFPWKFNDRNGAVGIKNTDNTVGASIKFIPGRDIDSEKVKHSSRSITRVSGLPEDIDLYGFLNLCNTILERYREKTKDIFLSSFKGLRQDGLYRRRLDYKTARDIMSYALYLSGGLKPNIGKR
jgi:hypothetical protein